MGAHDADRAAAVRPHAASRAGADVAELVGQAPAPAWLAYLLACFGLGVAGLYPITNPDLFGHLAQGRQIAALGHVPLRDSFSFWQPTPAPWHNYEWLSDLLTYRLYAALGFDAVLACKCALLMLAAALLVRLAQRLGGARAAWLCAVLIVLAIPAARFRLSERPQIVALPLSALYLLGLTYLLRGWGKGARRGDLTVIAGLGLSHVLWVNLHGSHLLGLTLVGSCLGLALWTRTSRWQLVTLCALQLLASCVSPFGPAILFDALAHVADPIYRELVPEWAAWHSGDPVWLLVAPLLQTLLLACCARALWQRGVAGRALLATSCLLAVMAFRSLRFVAEYTLLTAPALALGATHALRGLSTRSWRAGLAATLGLAALAVPWGASHLPPRLGVGHGADLSTLPAASAAWLRQRWPRPRLFSTFEDSWYLLFAVPEARVLSDGRVPFYGPAHALRMRQAFADASLLQRVLDAYRVDTVVVRCSFAPHRLMLQTLRALPDWSLVGLEDRYALFVRSSLLLRDGSAPRALGLTPGYETAWLLGASDAAASSILAELSRLPEHDNTRGYRGWVRALLSLRPQLRAGPGDGLRAPADAGERARLEQARSWLARAVRGDEAVPTVQAYYALVATLLCRTDEAHAALAIAREEGESRETLLTAQELALREGDGASVQAFVASAAQLAGADHDPWLDALRAELRAPVRCP